MMVTQRRRRLRKRLGPKRTAYLLETYVKPGVQHDWLCKKLRIGPATLWRILAEHGVPKKPPLGDNTAPYGLSPPFWARLKGRKHKVDPLSADELGRRCEQIHADAYRLSAARIKLARRFASPCLDPEDAAQEAVLEFLEQSRSAREGRNKWTPYVMAMSAATRAVHSAVGAAYLPPVEVGDRVMRWLVRREVLGLDPHANECELTAKTRAKALRFVSAAPGGIRPGPDRPLREDPELDADLVETIHAGLSLLRPRDAEVLRHAYGLEGRAEIKQKEIGRILRVSREMVRCLHNRALNVLREKCKLERFVGKPEDRAPRRARVGLLSSGFLLALCHERGFEPAPRRELAAVHKLLGLGIGMTPEKALGVWRRHGIEPGPSCSVLRRQVLPVLREAIWRIEAKINSRSGA